MRSHAFFLHAVLFCSGAAGLGYEMVWTRMLSAALGHEIIAVLAVVAAFFSGLALGSWALDRPVGISKHPGHWYAGLELTIGLWSVFLSIIFPWASRFVSGLMGVDPGDLQRWAVAFLFPFLLLLPATFAMGGTLPSMERLFSRLRGNGKTVGGLYAANTFGAVAGTLATTFWISPALGFKNTQLILGAVNFFCAAAVLLGAARNEENLAGVEVGMDERPASLSIAISLFATGLLGIGYEVLVVRALSQILENTVYSFAGILSVYLFGTALGAAIYQAWSPRLSFQVVTSYLAQGLSLACMVGLLLLLLVESIYSGVWEWIGHDVSGAFGGELCAACAVFLLPTILMGMTFSHLAQAACGKKGGFGRALSVNTVGAAIAPLLFGVVLLPAIGLKVALLLVAIGYLLLVPIPVGRTQWAGSLVPVFFCGLIYLSPLSIQFVEPPSGGKVVEYVESVMASVSVVSDASKHVHLKVNNRYQMGGTSSVFSDRRQGHIPLLLHPNPRTALFLGMGTGATLAASVDHPGLQTEGVELIPEIIPLLHHFKRSIGNLTSHPQVRLVVADARRYVNASTKFYDVIVADLFHPSRDGAGSLYTREHFTAIRSRLAWGGVFCQWLPLYQLDLETLRTITRTFLAVFPEGGAYLAHYSLKAPIIGLVATVGGKTYPANWLEERVRDSTLALRLRELRLHTDFNLFGCFVAGAEDLKRFAGTGPLNTDDRPLVTYQAPSFVYSNPEPAYRRLLVLLDAFHPAPEQVLSLSRKVEKMERHRRLADYWAARNQFLRVGVGVKETDDLQQLASQVKEPLLAIVRQSRDFDAAYNPLLSMASRLSQTDAKAAEQLLADLEKANPYRADARSLRTGILRAGRTLSPKP